MLEILTIARGTAWDFDTAVNEALGEGWELVRRECFITGSDRATTFYAELERMIEVEEEEEELEDDGTAEWVVARDPAHPYRCNKCQASTATPTPVCPECKRVMVSYRG